MQISSGPARKPDINKSSGFIKPVPIDSVNIENITRKLTGIKEFDRVLGGGIVPGSLVLIGGDPGIIPLTAPTSLEQLSENLGGLKIVLSADEIERLNNAGTP